MLTPQEKELLTIVIEVAGDMEDMIPAGITKALRGVKDRARQKYLRNVLSREARGKIRRARKKFSIPV